MKHILLSIALLALPALAEARAATLQLSGSDWRIHKDADGPGAERGLPTADPAGNGWIPAVVPGNIQSDLEAHHHLTPLWYGAGDDRLFDVACRNWWYRKDILVPETFSGQRLTLVFDGVDFECEIWLNGEMVGRNIGMHRRFTVDVSGVAKPGQSNQLAVRIARLPEDLEEMARINTHPGNYSGLRSIVPHLKDLKSATNWGYDWGVAIYTLGIWKDVRLEATGPARIEWTRVETALSEDHSKATVAVTLEIDSEKALDASVRFRITGPDGKAAEGAVEAPLTAGRNDVRAELVLEHPELWWPAGHGGQPLYTVHADLQAVNGGATLDARTTRFGVREVRWISTEGAPHQRPGGFQLILNGRPIRTIGSNLIPPDLLFGRMGPKTLNLIRRAKDSGANILRLWGGGVILREEAYDLADELGVMLILEIPLANHRPSTNHVYMANLDASARNIFKQTRNHPSIVEYAGGNEMLWRSHSPPPPLQTLMKAAAEEVDRIFRSTSPEVGSSHGPWISHLLDHYSHYDRLKTMRAAEFGTASPANLEDWHRTIPPASQWPINGTADPVLIRKNAVHGAFHPTLWLGKPTIEQLFGPIDTLPDLIEAGQFYGAMGLRQMIDAFRRKGRHIGGMTTWDFNEPWPNGAGSFLVDYDGRTLMNYDYFKQAVAPVALSLKRPSIQYHPVSGPYAELFLTSDAPGPLKDLQWSWLARDRRGRVIANGSGTASIDPVSSKSLGEIRIKTPANTGCGPIFVELQLRDSRGDLLTERLHTYLMLGVRTGFAGLLRNGEADSDDPDPSTLDFPHAAGPENLAFVGNAAAEASATSFPREAADKQPQGLNDGQYGHHSWWDTAAPQAQFTIDLRKTARVGRFKLGRHRPGGDTIRTLGSLKLETSLDGETWQGVYEQSGIAAMEEYRPNPTMTIEVNPVTARFIRGTVTSMDPDSRQYPRIDEFEVYAPSPVPPATLPNVTFTEHSNPPEVPWKPVTRTTLEVAAAPMRVEQGREVLDLTVSNRGSMTALFCQPHPLLDDRGDLFIDNNHCFIPPGESRIISVRADSSSSSGLSLDQTGWRISCWNAEDLLIEPGEEVLLAVGRRDTMCREFAGYGEIDPATGLPDLSSSERRIDPSGVAYAVGPDDVATFEFDLTRAQARRPARLRIHTTDQAAGDPTRMMVSLNGGKMESSLPAGLGIQKTDPSHLAFPASVEFVVDPKNLRSGTNRLEVRVDENGWFSWDAMELISQ